MLKFAARRLISLIPILLGSTFVVFVLLDFAPGDPAVTIAGKDATAAEVDRIREHLGLDDPLLVRYGRYMGDLVRGDFGTSLFSSRTVESVIVHRAAITLGVVVPALLLSISLALVFGVTAALNRDQWADRAMTATSSLLLAVPSFVLGVVLVGAFAVRRAWFPAVGYSGPSEGVADWLRYITLPAITLGVAGAAELARQIRGALVETLDEDYIRAARAKGLSRRAIVGKHAAKNAAIPVVTVLGLNVATLIGGAILVEKVFAIPGMGALVIDSVLRRDIPMIQGVVVASAISVIAVNLLVDLSYGYFNPRLREQ